MACPRIVGLDVSPVTARSRTYRASAPVRSMTRLMLSSHRLWPSACSCCAGLGSASMRASETSAVAAPIRPVIHVDDSWAAQDLGRLSHALPGGAGAPPQGAHYCDGRRAMAVISTFAPSRRTAPTVVRTGRGGGKWRSYTALKRSKSARSARWTRQDTTSAGAQPAAPSSAVTLPSVLSVWSSIVSPVPVWPARNTHSPAESPGEYGPAAGADGDVTGVLSVIAPPRSSA